MNNKRRILIVAGEASGDLYGAKLVTEFKHLHPNVHFYGMSGKLMQQAGVEILVANEELALVGLVDVIIHFRKIRAAFKKIQSALERNPPDLVILIDYPGFNLRFAKIAKKNNVKVLYYISPQIWAWRKGRVKTIQRYVDHMAVILPFEVDLYKKTHVPVTFVGHPLLNIAKPSMTITETKKFFALNPHQKIIGLMPGSRKSEIKYLLPVMLKAAEILQKQDKNLQFVLPLATSLDEKYLTSYLAKTNLPIKISKDPHLTYDVMQICDAIIAASGTVTLEIALVGTPLLIIYKSSWLNYHLAKFLIKVPFLGLPNLIAQKKIVPELLQNAATPEAVANEITKILNNKAYRDKMLANLQKVKKMLDAPAYMDIAKLTWEMLS